jgi:hypothetical protein
MGLLPLIFSSLSIFTILVVITLLISFITYKIKSPKRRPYLENQPVPVAIPISPVYVQNVREQEIIRQEPVVYQTRQVSRAPQQQYNTSERFQVLNSQAINPFNSYTYYK